MLGLGAVARQANAQGGARGQMPPQGGDIFNRYCTNNGIHIFPVPYSIEKST